MTISLRRRELENLFKDDQWLMEARDISEVAYCIKHCHNMKYFKLFVNCLKKETFYGKNNTLIYYECFPAVEKDFYKRFLNNIEKARKTGKKGINNINSFIVKSVFSTFKDWARKYKLYYPESGHRPKIFNNYPVRQFIYIRIFKNWYRFEECWNKLNSIGLVLGKKEFYDEILFAWSLMNPNYRSKCLKSLEMILSYYPWRFDGIRKDYLPLVEDYDRSRKSDKSDDLTGSDNTDMLDVIMTTLPFDAPKLVDKVISTFNEDEDYYYNLYYILDHDIKRIIQDMSIYFQNKFNKDDLAKIEFSIRRKFSLKFSNVHVDMILKKDNAKKKKK